MLSLSKRYKRCYIKASRRGLLCSGATCRRGGYTQVPRGLHKHQTRSKFNAGIMCEFFICGEKVNMIPEVCFFLSTQTWVNATEEMEVIISERAKARPPLPRGGSQCPHSRRGRMLAEEIRHGYKYRQVEGRQWCDRSSVIGHWVGKHLMMLWAFEKVTQKLNVCAIYTLVKTSLVIGSLFPHSSNSGRREGDEICLKNLTL